MKKMLTPVDLKRADHTANYSGSFKSAGSMMAGKYCDVLPSTGALNYNSREFPTNFA
jgi:hypothetical protein